MKTRTFLYSALAFYVLMFVLVIWPGAKAWRVWRQERLNRTLIAAIRRNDTQRVIQMLEQGADANAHSLPDAAPFQQTVWGLLQGGRGAVRASGPTPLQTLFADEEDVQRLPKRQEPVEVVQALIARGANVCVTDSFGVPVIVYADVYRGNWGESNLHCVRLLLEAGADVNAETRSRRSLLFCAIQVNDLNMAKLLLSRGAKCQIDGENIPALRAARRYDNPPEMLALLKKYGYKD